MCTDGTGIVPPDIVPIYGENIVELNFQRCNHFLTGASYSFVLDEMEKVVHVYEKPTVKKSIAGLIDFRQEIAKSQETMNQSLSGSWLSFDQSFYNRTLGQIVIQYKLEKKLGNLTERFQGFSGAGFGALQMFSCAMGYETDELNIWFTTSLYSAVRRKLPARIVHGVLDVMLNKDPHQLRSNKVENEIRYFFKAKDINGKRTNRDLTVKECKKEVYLPLWDMSRRTITITRKTFGDMPIYIAACMAVLDPIFFRTKSRKRYIKDLGLMNVDVVKNNDVYLRKYNPNISVTSIGSPVRCYDKGFGNMDIRSPLLQLLNIKHDTDLDWSRSCGSKRYECNPVDELYQFPKSEKSIGIAQKSGDIDV